MSLARALVRRFLSSTARPPPPPPALVDSPDPADSALSRRFTALAEAALTASPHQASAIAAANNLPAPPAPAPAPPTSVSAERAETHRLLRDRFTGPITFEALASLADAKITAARQRGEFAVLRGRGKPLERDHSAFVDPTEFLLNRILQRHGAAPAWIEKQAALETAVRGFRGRLRRDWTRHAARCIASAGGGVKAADFCDADWEALERPYLALAVEELNSRTRAYNLLAPVAAQKPYFSLERELQRCFRECAAGIAGGIEGGTAKQGGAQTQTQIQDSGRPNYGFRQFWRDLWGGK